MQALRNIEARTWGSGSWLWLWHFILIAANRIISFKVHLLFLRAYHTRRVRPLVSLRPLGMKKGHWHPSFQHIFYTCDKSTSTIYYAVLSEKLRTNVEGNIARAAVRWQRYTHFLSLNLCCPAHTLLDVEYGTSSSWLLMKFITNINLLQPRSNKSWWGKKKVDTWIAWLHVIQLQSTITACASKNKAITINAIIYIELLN